MNDLNSKIAEHEQLLKQKEQYDELLRAFKWIFIGFLFYLIRLSLTFGAGSLNSTLVGEIIILRALLLFTKHDSYGNWVYVAIMFSVLHILSDFVAIIGLSNQFNLKLQMFETVAILLIYHRLLSLVPAFNEHRRTIVISLVSLIGAATLGLALIFITPFLVWSVLVLKNVELFSALITFFGVMLPFTALWMAGTALSLYVTFSLYKILKNSDYKTAFNLNS